MKKLCLWILMFLFCFGFCGCSPKLPDKINTHIDASFTAEYGELKMGGLLIYSEEGDMYLDISTPDELYSLSYSWSDDFTIGYKGLNAKTNDGYLPDTSFAQALKNTLTDISVSSPALKRSDRGGFEARGKTDSGCYIVYTDENGVIRKIDILPLELSVEFGNINP